LLNAAGRHQRAGLAPLASAVGTLASRPLPAAIEAELEALLVLDGSISAASWLERTAALAERAAASGQRAVVAGKAAGKAADNAVIAVLLLTRCPQP
ncbi:MAG TPA: hypothetical protein VKZ41_12300, partial [Gemmatimonadales bacterium]|nr:hypothetical protein [Gemmatimonadales bacterium]